MKTIKKILEITRKHRSVLAAFLAGLVFAIISYLAMSKVAKFSSSPQFCATTCHEMGTAYRTWELSKHHSNKHGLVAQCIDCHLPPKDKFITHMIAKTYVGLKDAYQHSFGGEYNVEESSEKVLEAMPNSRCLKCHGNLLGKPVSSAARTAHQEVLHPPQDEDEQLRCVECHSELHERTNRIFVPDN